MDETTHLPPSAADVVILYENLIAELYEEALPEGDLYLGVGIAVVELPRNIHIDIDGQQGLQAD